MFFILYISIPLPSSPLFVHTDKCAAYALNDFQFRMGLLGYKPIASL